MDSYLSSAKMLYQYIISLPSSERIKLLVLLNASGINKSKISLSFVIGYNIQIDEYLIIIIANCGGTVNSFRRI